MKLIPERIHIGACPYLIIGIALLVGGIIYSPKPGTIPILTIISVTISLIFIGKAVSLILRKYSPFPQANISSALTQYYCIVVLTALSFESLCGYFFIGAIPFHDNASFYSLFHDNLQSLNYFGGPAWWFPHNQFGFPGYFYSILGNMNCLSPVFISLAVLFWVLGRLGIYISNILPLYIWYFGAIVPFIFSLCTWFFARQFLKSTVALIFVSILAAFSPGVILNYGDLGLLEPAAYGLFLAASYIRFINRPGSNSFLTLVLSLLIFAVTINYTLIIFNLVFIPGIFIVCLFPEQSLTKVRKAFSLISQRKWALVALLFFICMAPSLITFSQKGDIVRTTLFESENKYLFLNNFPGNPLEPLLAGTPGVGVFGKDTGKGSYVNFPVVLGNGYMGYCYLGILTISLAIIGLLYGQIEWRVRLFILLLVFYAIIILSNYSPIFLMILSLNTPLTHNSHFNDVLYRSGAFIFLIFAAGLGLDVLQLESSHYRRLIIFFSVLITLSCGLHMYLSHDNLIILGIILGFTIILGLFYFIVLAWLKNNQLGVYKDFAIGLLLFLVLCDVSTIAHLHVRSVMFPNFRGHNTIVDFDAQNNDKIGVAYYAANGQADSTLSSKALMKLQKNGIPISELPQYALFKNGYISKGDSSSDFDNIILRKTLAINNNSVGKDLDRINTYNSGESKSNSEIVLENKTYTTMQFRVKAGEESLFFVRDAYHPYWQAMINGHETKINRSMNNFKAIIIPKGESIVRFNFHPPGIAIAIAMAYLAIFIVAFMWAAQNLYNVSVL